MKFRTISNSLYIVDEQNMLFSRLNELPVGNNPTEPYQMIALYRIPEITVGERVRLLFSNGDVLTTTPVKEIVQ